MMIAPASKRSPSTLAAVLATACLLSSPSPANAQAACPNNLTPAYNPPVVAEGWKAQLVATGLSRPRGIKFDSAGNLLVVEPGVGLTRLTFEDYGGTCLVVKEKKTIIPEPGLNHGLDLSDDGTTLYVSTVEYADRYTYDAATATVSNRTRLVTGMSHATGGHSTRTLLLSRKYPDLLLVSRGSGPNIDPLAQDVSTGVSQIRAFNVSEAALAANGGQPYRYATSGTLVGWGLRNSVGVGEHPLTGEIWSVENSADNIFRAGVDVHEDNPGEELNFHGVPVPDEDNPNPFLGANYGYPLCLALWNTTDFPNIDSLTVGKQFALNDTTASDEWCDANTTPPRITFRAHTAPLDIKFSPAGDRAFVTFHGSWNRDQPAGYSLSYLDFDTTTAQPTAPANSLDAVRNILSAPDVSICARWGGGPACLRPVGLAWDASGERLFVSSDATGEVWVVTQAAGGDGGEVTSVTSRAAGVRRATPVPAKFGRGWMVVGAGAGAGMAGWMR
ncbi:hypothetical protein VTJ04DRAFT_6659 [Mycothermus thermophilus]|uniref:uncharacterized protein n=1 Tax=Humicola insolens TaxID=85995 RepID=UPI003743E677